MSELTLFVLQYGFLLLLWIFVFVLIFALRADVFGGRVRRLPESSAPSPPVVAPAAPADSHAETVAHDMPRGSASSDSEIGRVVITSGPRAGLEIPLGADPLTIGRSSESGLVIRDDYTSSHHARLIRYDGRWMLQDLDSTNGTFHDGERVTSGSPVAIRPGAPIKVGATTFELRK